MASGLWTPPTADPTSPTSPTHPAHSRTASISNPNAKIKYQGKKIAQIVKLKPEYVEKYKECHAKVWPEVLKQIKECNIEDYSIFHDESTGILFASFKYVGYNYGGDMEKMRDNPKVREWWKMTDGYQESLVEGAVSSEKGGVDGMPDWWKGLEQVFYLA